MKIGLAEVPDTMLIGSARKKVSKSRSAARILLLLCFVTSSAFTQEPQFIIEGANPRLENNIRAHVSVPNLACSATPARLNRFSNDIDKEAKRAARALGYYKIQSSISFEKTELCWNLLLEVQPGEPVTIASINIAVATNPELFTSVLNTLPLTVGGQLYQNDYERVKDRLISQAIDEGFLSARFERSQLLLDLEANTASVSIDFNPGEQHRFGAIEIAASESLSEEFIRRYIDFSENEPYSSSALIELRNSFNDSQYFSSVAIAPGFSSNTNNLVPIDVALSMRPQRVYSAGGGLTTDIGPRGKLSFENRYLNRNGHKFDIGTGISPIEQVLDANYIMPMSKPATESLRFSAGFQREDNDTFKNESFKIGSAYSFINNSAWRQNIFLNFQHDDFEVAGENEVADLLIAGVNIAKTSADDALYPRKGWRLFAQLRGASESIISTESFLQFNLNGKWVSAAGPGRLLARFDIGTTLVDDVSQLPVSIQYFAGGDQSVRGYRYQSLGPLNDEGEVVGGKHLAIAGVEYDFSILPDWKLAVFADAGNAFSDFNNLELQKSVGLGVRWLSPIGPIRLDLASALDDDNKLRLHITMGPDL